MLGNKAVHPTLPAVDLKRAKKFYEDKLGLKVLMEDPSPGITFQAGGGTMLYVYQRELPRQTTPWPSSRSMISKVRLRNLRARV